MQARMSAGLLMYRQCGRDISVLLVHPGGPYFRRKDAGAWSIPKGEVAPGEDPLAAAVRECQEELGVTPAGPFEPLTPITQRGGKHVYAWCCRGDFGEAVAKSNTFTLEWPPRSGRHAEFPEIDRAEFFPLSVARRKINQAQASFLDELERRLSAT